MKFKLHIYIMLLLCMTLFFSCSNDNDPSAEESKETVTLLIAAPQSAATRADMGDPGEEVHEGEDWDNLSVILAYTKLEGESASASLPVIVKTISKQEFDRLPVYSGTPYKQISLYVRRGTVHIYGMTYSRGADADLDKAIQACGNSTEASVRNLTISNGYASGDTEKFLSVATGYYQDNNNDLAEYEISKPAEYGEIKPIPSMRLTRLAAKIDIQWDAQDAYTQGYTDVKVDDFTFYNINDETKTGKGKGCLFPKLYKGSETFAGQAVFQNTSDISKRNGRVYHHVFPCKGTPHVKFKLSAKKDNIEQNQDYTFQFPGEIQQATWYKVNATIRGVTGTTTITRSQQ